MAAPATLEELAALAAIEPDELCEFEEDVFVQLLDELGVSAIGKHRLRKKLRAVAASQQLASAQAKFGAFFVEPVSPLPVSPLPGSPSREALSLGTPDGLGGGVRSLHAAALRRPATAEQHLEAAGWAAADGSFAQAAADSNLGPLRTSPAARNGKLAPEPEPEPEPKPEPEQQQPKTQATRSGQVAKFRATGKIVVCTVPEGSTTAAIEAFGAQGGGKMGGLLGSKEGGRGARVVCRAAVQPGERLAVLVGQAGGTARGSGGGGGGSFVVRAADGSPLAVAGGGGGAGYSS